MLKIIYNKWGGHITSLSLVLILMGTTLFLGIEAVDDWLPYKGKAVVAFVFFMSIIQLELHAAYRREDKLRYEQLAKKMSSLFTANEVSTLKLEINSLYADFMASGEGRITSEPTIKALMGLKDRLDMLGVNSYSQARLNYMCSKIKRVK